MGISTLLLFFVYTWGLGGLVTYFVDKKEFWETTIMRVGFGLGIFSILAALFTLLHIPLDWKLFLALSLIAPILGIIQKKKLRITKPTLTLLLVFVLFGFTLFMYHKGAFALEIQGQQYYENGDPWKHAAIAKYIALEKTALEPIPGEQVFHYIDSYPPAYDTLLGVLYQTSGDIIWVVKFFNALLLSLGILFFYFFTKTFFKDSLKALFATFVLTMIPSYMSHFIWAHTLVVLLLFPLLYALTKINEDKKYWIAAATTYAGLVVVQSTQAVKISFIVLIYILVKSWLDKKWALTEAKAFLVGGFLGGLSWWIPNAIRYGSIKTMILNMGTKAAVREGSKLKFYGSADRVYVFKDFFYAKAQNMINNPIGVGVVLTILLLISVVLFILYFKQLKEKQHYTIITAALLLFTFLGIHGERLPVQLYAFRFWMLFSVFASIFITFGVWELASITQKIINVKKGIVLLILMLILIPTIWATSGQAKYDLNTAQWGTSGAYTKYDQFGAWVWLGQQPKDTKVFYPCRQQKEGAQALLALNLFSCEWCKDERDFKKTFNETPPAQTHTFLQQKNYEYLFIDGNCERDFGMDKTVELLQTYTADPLFTPVVNTPGGVVYALS
jgi:hypothetical protein